MTVSDLVIRFRHNRPVLDAKLPNGTTLNILLDAPKPNVALNSLTDNAGFTAHIVALIQDAQVRVTGFRDGSPVIERDESYPPEPPRAA